MAFIGNSVQNQGFAPAVDYFNGDGTTVTFTLSRPVASVAQLTAVIENVIQNPATAFTVSGNQLTFTSAPPAGTNNIWIEYTSLITQYNGISQDPSVVGDITASGGYLATGDFGNSYLDGTVVDYVTGMSRITTGPIDDMTFYHGGTSARSEMMTLYYAGGAKVFGNTALTIPSGTTAQRPGTPENGMIRFNTTTSQNEIYQNGQWIAFATQSATSISYLMVAGGGSGGCGYGGGGGAGGLLASTTSVTPGVSYTITIGAGGASVQSGTDIKGLNGSNTTAFSLTAIGGGGGGAEAAGTGLSGGSGGGGTYNAAGGAGTSGQGYAGTQGIFGGFYPSGGGGGAGAVGGAPANNTPGGTAGVGGVGVASSISGSSVYYAGGGGGSAGYDSGGGYGGAGGNGGGGKGADDGSYGGGNASTGTAGTANTGGGGGGGNGHNTASGAGGSGVVIVSYAATYRAAIATGTYTQVTSGGNYIYTFTGSGTITF